MKTDSKIKMKLLCSRDFINFCIKNIYSKLSNFNNCFFCWVFCFCLVKWDFFWAETEKVEAMHLIFEDQETTRLVFCGRQIDRRGVFELVMSVSTGL